MVTVGDVECVNPDPTSVPTHDPVNQYQFAPVPRLPPVNDRVDDAPGQIDDGFAEAEVAGVDSVFIFTVTLKQDIVELQRPRART